MNIVFIEKGKMPSGLIVGKPYKMTKPWWLKIKNLFKPNNVYKVVEVKEDSFSITN